MSRRNDHSLCILREKKVVHGYTEEALNELASMFADLADKHSYVDAGNLKAYVGKIKDAHRIIKEAIEKKKEGQS